MSEAYTVGPVKGPPVKWDKPALIAHVKTGMQVELSTLPIYLCALYSIVRDNGGWGTKARGNILAVAEQEMLHLALAGNMLRALDATQPLYAKDFLPTYPGKILYEEIPMKLQPANKENLECFLKIEAPYMPPPLPPIQPMFYTTALPEYRSIGEFYKKLEEGIRELAPKDPHLFASNKDQQFQGGEFFDSEMIVVTNERSALEALQIIVDQGEGSIGVPESHYVIFVELYQMRKEWTCVNYIEEPRTAKYKSNEIAYQLALALDASYCYLLQTIDRCWTEKNAVTRMQLFRNIHRIMVELVTPVAVRLVQQPIGSDGKFAAPCFEFYPPDSKTPAAPSALYDGLKEEVQKAQAAAEKAGQKDTAAAIAKIAHALEGLDPGL